MFGKRSAITKLPMNMKQYNAYYTKKYRNRQEARRGGSALDRGDSGYAQYTDHRDRFDNATPDYYRQRSY